MSVRVLTDYGSTVTHDDATHFKVGGADDDTLFLFALPDDWPIATYARGRWVSAQRVAAPEPEPPLLKPGTLVRIPGMDVPYVVDKGLATSGPHATLTFTTVDGRDWSDDRTVNAAESDAEPGEERRTVTTWPITATAEGLLSVLREPRPEGVKLAFDVTDADVETRRALRAKLEALPTAAAEPDCQCRDHVAARASATPEPIPDAAKCPSVTLAPKSVNPGEDAEYRAALDELRATSTTAEAVLSETTEPYVSVNLSVTSDNSAEVVKVIRKLVREGRLSAGSLA